MSTRAGVQPASGAFGAALGAALLFAAHAVPPVGSLFAMISPLPLILRRLRGRPLPAYLTALLAAAVVGAAFGPGRAMVFVFFLVAPGLLLAESMIRNRGLASGLGLAFSVTTVQVLIVLAMVGPRLSREALQAIESVRSPQMVEMLRTRGWSVEDVDNWIEASRRAQAVLAVIYPAIFVIAGAAAVLANAAMLRVWLAWRDPGWLADGRLDSLRWPFGLTVAFVVAGAAALVPASRPVGLNLLLPVLFLFGLQGLAVAAFYLSRIQGPILLRVGLALLVLLNPWALSLLGLLGLLDNWFDFRRFAAPKAEGQ